MEITEHNYSNWKGQTRYRKVGHKLTAPIDDTEFLKRMSTGNFCNPDHKSYCALVYYSAVRKTEALRVKPEQFSVSSGALRFNVRKA